MKMVSCTWLLPVSFHVCSNTYIVNCISRSSWPLGEQSPLLQDGIPKLHFKRFL